MANGEEQMKFERLRDACACVANSPASGDPDDDPHPNLVSTAGKVPSGQIGRHGTVWDSENPEGWTYIETSRLDRPAFEKRAGGTSIDPTCISLVWPHISKQV